MKMDKATDGVDDNAMIWHYMRFTKFVSMLDDRPWWFFARPFRFDDRWEGWFPPSYLRNTKKYAEEHNIPFKEFEEEFTKRLKRHRYGHFVNCWHISDDESDAMWRLYGLAPEGVAIQSTIGSVKECLRPHRAEAVIYYDPSDDIRSESIFGPNDILFKRKCFSWEREFRLWFDDDELLTKIEQNEEIKEAEISPGKLVQIGDIQKLIRRLVVAPGASDSFVKLVKGVCSAYGRTLLASRVERSYSDRLWDSFTK
jgi:hypothetical protein